MPKKLIFNFFHKASETDDLNRDGIWVPWNSRKSGVPPNAVVGGRDENGNIYVIRADHYQDGVSYRGIIPGRYSPNLSYASIAYYNKEYRYKHFEVWIFHIDPFNLNIQIYFYHNRFSLIKIVSGKTKQDNLII